MKLYHYTSTLHIPLIRTTGYLRYGDIPLRKESKYGESGHAVWLTTKDYAASGEHGLISPVCDKTEIRFSLDIPRDDPRLFRWSEYAKVNHIQKAWYAAIDEAGGGFSDTWWLFVRPIQIDGLGVAVKQNNKYVSIDINDIPAHPNAQNTMHTDLGIVASV